MPHAVSMLIADDSPSIQKILNDAARASKLPLLITTTDNGRDCLTLLNGGNVDLAFIDIHMPELSGMEAFWVARKQGIRTFVTMMTTSPSEDTLEVAQRLKAYEFLTKPFTVPDVVAIMHTFSRVASPTNVLVVDDSATVRQIIQKVVQGSIFNCAITEATDGATALALCDREKFDVVFLDCNMPNLDGLMTLKRLLAIQPTLKVVMISSERSAEKERLAQENGACGFLHKPFYSETVDRMLHVAFGLRPQTLTVKNPDGDTISCPIQKDSDARAACPDAEATRAN
jgi:CheY-like chemotaxis protein